MKAEERNKVLDTMAQIVEQVDSHLDIESQERGNITYYSDFKFGNSGLGANNVYIVETPIKEEQKNGDKDKNRTIYEIYDEDRNLIATVTEEGKIHFTPEYLEQLKQNYGIYFRELRLEDLEFELPEELTEKDITMTKQEIDEHEQGREKKERTIGREKDTEEKADKDEGEKEANQETEDEKKQRTAQALGVDESEIKSICTIDLNEKITDEYALRDIIPETAKYEEVSIACTNKGNAQFTTLGVQKEGQREQLKSIEPVEGVETNKTVISVNEDGSEVTEKQVKGLFRINAKNREDGISVSTGDYGMMNVDYVRNIMDKEHRRATPIRTREAENQRMPSREVRENAGDSKEEVEKEGRIYRARKEKGIDPQSLDGIVTNNMQGKDLTLEELRKQIKEEVLDQEDMSKGEMQEFIKAKIAESGINLSDQETQMLTDEIETEVEDESRFPTKGSRI